MKTADYWKSRFNGIEQTEHEKGVACFNDIESNFQAAQRDLESQIATWYQRIADNNDVTLSDARKLLRGKELQEFRWTVDEYIKHGEENAIDQRWMKQLENASAKAHISRLEAMQIQLQQTAEKFYGNTLDSIDSTMREIYKDGVARTAFEVQRGLGVGFDFSVPNEKQIEKVLYKPWAQNGDNFSDSIWKQKNKLVSELNTTFVQGIITGKNPRKITDALSERLRVSKSNAGRLVMTESAYFTQQAQKDSFSELGVEEYEIDATLDSRTSDICRGMDGQHFKMSEWEVGVTAPPFHPWCRTVSVPYFGDEQELGLIEKRVARDENGKIYEIPQNITYEEWQKYFLNGGSFKEGLKEIRVPVDVEYDSIVSGYKTISGGFKIADGQKFDDGSETKIITLDKRTVFDWDGLPESTKKSLRYTSMDNKAFNLAKGSYEVERYVEGSIENIERDEIAKSLGGEYLGFAFHNKSGQYIDFYKVDDKLISSIGEADLKRTVTEASLQNIEKIVAEREKAIIESVGEENLKDLTARNGDDWVAAMRDFHRVVSADGKPKIISEGDYDNLPCPVLYRGIAPQSTLRKDITTTQSTKEMAEEFFNGLSPFPSRGVYGDGVAYASPAYRKIAWNYATNGGSTKHGGVIIEFKLDANARTIQYEDALDIFQKLSKKKDSRLLFNGSQRNAPDSEVGKAMNALGYDAIIKHNGDNTGEDFYVILNRGALVTTEKYITKAL